MTGSKPKRKFAGPKKRRLCIGAQNADIHFGACYEDAICGRWKNWLEAEAMTQQEQSPDYQELHFAILEAIKKYEVAINWSVVDLKFTAKKGVSDLEVMVLPNPSSPR
jgi:hypothetical protein